MWSLFTVLALVLTDGNAIGQGEMIKLLASDGVAVDMFGLSVSISGIPGNEIIIVGSPGDDVNGRDSGSAYIYRRSGVTWVEEQKLFPSDRAAGDSFGRFVSISGVPGNEIAIIGAVGKGDKGSSSGSAYIYRFNGENWVEEQKLLASDGAAEDYFGACVSISGVPGNEVAIVGAWGDDDNGSRAGSAYIYRFDPELPGWTEEAKLLASGGMTLAEFGYSVSIGGGAGNEVAIVGSHSASTRNGFYSGSAYIYRFNGVEWVEEQKLLASDGNHNDYFGLSVSMSAAAGGEVAIVGANGKIPNSATFGSAYIFRFDGVSWLEEQKIIVADGAGNNWSTQSVSISGSPGNEFAIISGHADDNGLFIAGSAYIYRHDGVNWIEEQEITASNDTEFDAFGQSVSISGATENVVAIIGAQVDGDNGMASGAAYVFDLAASPTFRMPSYYEWLLIIVAVVAAFSIVWSLLVKRAKR